MKRCSLACLFPQNKASISVWVNPDIASALYYNGNMPNIIKVGVDEVGRGPLAGPVTVCVFAVKKGFSMRFLNGITDSKKLSQQKREYWSRKLHSARREGEVLFAITSVSAREIDKKGIVKAIQVAIRTALRKLKLNPNKSEIFLDGSLKAPTKFLHQKTIIGGDRKNKLISTASVLAKVHRDAYMTRLAQKYPVYGFDIHKGYGTRIHRKAIKRDGVCGEHRNSFCRNVV